MEKGIDMKRRAFIQFVCAIPVLGALTIRFVPEKYLNLSDIVAKTISANQSRIAANITANNALIKEMGYGKR